MKKSTITIMGSIITITGLGILVGTNIKTKGKQKANGADIRRCKLILEDMKDSAISIMEIAGNINSWKYKKEYFGLAINETLIEDTREIERICDKLYKLEPITDEELMMLAKLENIRNTEGILAYYYNKIEERYE